MLARLSRWTLPTIVLVVGLGIYRLALTSPTDASSLEPDHPSPVRIEPEHDVPQMVTDEQLRQVLGRMQPPKTPGRTNDWVHALRMWGPVAEFDDPETPSGPTLLNYFLDDRVFQQYAGKDAPPLFSRLPDGRVVVRSFDDDHKFRTSSSYHRDDLLATLAESGVAPSTPLLTRDGPAVVGDLLKAAMLDVHPHLHEYEWSVISYARYLHPHGSWQNKFGQRLDADQLVAQLIQHDLELGPCDGLHRLEAMVVLYRADQAQPGLSERTRQRMLAHMTAVSSRLVAAQSSDGSWSRFWSRGAAGKQDKPASIDERILVTGHHLEWLALAPGEVHPPRETLVRAGQWLTRTILEVDAEKLKQRYGPFSHAARALCLWRGSEPAEVWNSRSPDTTPAE